MPKLVLHLIPDEKFTSDYIRKINSLFDSSRHRFCVIGSSGTSFVKASEFPNCQLIRYKEQSRLKEWSFYKSEMNAADRIVLHSLFVPGLLLVMFNWMLPIIREKAVWVIWGGDLYDAWRCRNDNLKMRVVEQLRKRIIGELSVVAANETDFAYLKERYATKAVRTLATYAYDFSYLINKDETSEVNILLGNSANPTNRHLETIDILAPYANQNIKFFCPLSYSGSTQYVQRIIKKGLDVFGDKFVPLTDLLSFEDYADLLSKIDVAVFNHNRQQAFGNITELLYCGAQVFVSPSNPNGQFYRSLGATVRLIDELTPQLLIKKSKAYGMEANKEIIKEYYSDEAFAARWSGIFDNDWQSFS